jgi:hypothetical protein
MFGKVVCIMYFFGGRGDWVLWCGLCVGDKVGSVAPSPPSARPWRDHELAWAYPAPPRTPTQRPTTSPFSSR